MGICTQRVSYYLHYQNTNIQKAQLAFEDLISAQHLLNTFVKLRANEEWKVVFCMLILIKEPGHLGFLSNCPTIASSCESIQATTFHLPYLTHVFGHFHCFNSLFL